MFNKAPVQPVAKRSRLRIALALAAGWLLTLTLPGQAQTAPPAQDSSAERPAGDEAEPPLDLRLARLTHQRELLSASLSPLKTYISELDELSKTLAGARDYEGALEAVRERQQMQTELERIAKEMLLLEEQESSLKSALLPDRISLPLNQARLEGVEWDRSTASLTQWQQPGVWAEWTLPNLPPGGYEVILTYECNPIEGGTVIVSEEAFTLTAEMDTTLRGPEAKNLGTLKITNGSGPLRLTARSVVKSNLMNLIAVELVPSNR